MSQKDQISRNDAIEIIADQLTKPITVKEFTTRVLDIWPSNAKNPHSGVRQAMRGYEHHGRTILYIDDDTVTSMKLAMQGIQWRVPLSAQEVDKGILYSRFNFDGFMPRRFDVKNLQLVDATDHTIPTEIVEQTKRVDTIFGESTQTITSLNLGWWFRKHKVSHQDHVLITLLDWPTGRYRLEVEPYTTYMNIKDDIALSNQIVIDELFAALENSRDERVNAHIVVAAAYVHLQAQLPATPDHWIYIMAKDGRMGWNGYQIGYAETSPLLFDLLGSEPPSEPDDPPALTTAQRDQVYQFKAHLKHKKSLWRRIEIQGGDTLHTFDHIMRQAFQFDMMDHLSGFWHRIQRGKTNNYRELDLATIYPYGEQGEGADIEVATLGLEVGGKLKYVYDFGDWIECHLELEKLTEPDETADYPRIIAQNKLRYRYCPTCKAEGKKEVATYICYTCSNEQQKQVLMCKEHIIPDHEEHYLEEILY